MKKAVALILVIVLVACAAVSGTLAVLSTTDENVNTFVSGRVKIDLWEDFGDNSGIETLVPSTGKDENGNITNAVEKEVYIENTGTEEAYVRVHIAIPAILDDGADTFDASANILHFNYDKASVREGLWNWKTEDGTTWNYYTCEIGGVAYNVYVVTYETALDPGFSTVDAISQVYLDSAVTNEDLDRLDEILGDEWYIYVGAEAVQADGYTDAYSALNTAFGVPGEYHFDWLAVTSKDVVFLDTIYVSSAEEWAEALYGKAYTGYIILTDDIILDGEVGLWINADDNVIVNLGGHSIQQNNWINVDAEEGISALFNYGTAVITGDGHVIATGYAVVNYGTMTVNHGTFEGYYGGMLNYCWFNGEDTTLTIYDGVFTGTPEGLEYWGSIGLENWGGTINIYGGTYSGYEDGIINDYDYDQDDNICHGHAYIYGIDSARSTYRNQGTGVTNGANNWDTLYIMDGDYYDIFFDNVVIKGGAFTDCRISDSTVVGDALFEGCTIQHLKSKQFCSVSNGTFNYCDFIGKAADKLYVSILYGEFNYCNMDGCYIMSAGGLSDTGIVCYACDFGYSKSQIGTKLLTEVKNGTYRNCYFGECNVTGGLMDSACVISDECTASDYTLIED